jgi:hypothetical protein
MTRSEYLERLLALGAGLRARPTQDAQARQQYISRLVEWGRSLTTQAEPVPATEQLANFCRLVMPNRQEILWRVTGATAQRRRALSAQGRTMLNALETCPDLLGTLERARDEVTHTKILAHFLDPSRSGGVGSACVKAFVDLILTSGSEEDMPALPDGLNLKDLNIRTERHLGKYGRVDLSLDSLQALVLVEVKIDALERPGQLSDYASALDELYLSQKRHTMLIFLTRTPDQAPSIKRSAVHITFRDVLTAWLSVAISGRTEDHIFLSMYLKTIACHLYGLMAAGSFESWPLATQRRALQFLESEVTYT